MIGHTRAQKNNFVSIVGLRGAPLGLVRAYGEAPVAIRSAVEMAIPHMARGCVEHIASDVCSPKLFTALRVVMPQLKSMSLDAMHLCFAVDSHTKKHRIRPTVIGLVVRSIMGKFNIPSKRLVDTVPYCGQVPLRLTAEEATETAHIRDGDLPHTEAKQCLLQMNPNVAMLSLAEFAHLIAAVVVVYPQHMDTTHDKTTLRRILLHACTPARFQWYLNNVRYRSSIPWQLERFMAAGTTRNEQLHARLNAHYRGTVSISKRVLTAEVNTWLAAEMAVFLKAFTAKLSRRMQRVDMLPFVASTTTIFFTDGMDEVSEC